MSDSYADSLARHGLEDVQPLYRQLLLRLKQQDAAAYDLAVARYKDEVEARVGDAEDPVQVWVDYGVWLADWIADGQLKTVGENGLATDAADPAPLGPMLMHLPSDQKIRGILLAMPSDASPAQTETASLLCA